VGEWTGEIIALLLYGLYFVAQRLFKRQQVPEGARPPPPPPSAPARRPPEADARPAPLPQPWREMERLAVEIAAVPDLFAIADAAHQAGRAFFRSVPGLEPELRARTGLPRFAPLPDSVEGMSMRQLALPLGPWLPTLFADAFATIALGPAYVIGLRRRLATDDPDRAVTIATDASESGYGPVPPSHLRVLLCCDLAAQLGHTAEASRQLSLWNGTLGAIEVFLIPTLDGDWIEAPVDPLREFGERVQEVIVSEPLASLRGAKLVQLPGLRFSHHDQTSAEGAALTLARGDTVRAAPRVAMAAALIAADEAHASHEKDIHGALRRSLAPVEKREAPAPARRRGAAAPPAVAPATHAGFVDISPEALREAVIARAILWR